MAADAPRFSGRFALRIEEAAASIGLSRGAFREHVLPDCPKIHAGRTVLIPAGPFKEYLAERAEKEGIDVGSSVEDLFDSLDSE